MSITPEEAAETITIKKRLREIVAKTEDKRLIRADQAYHEAGSRWLKENGFDGEIQARGGDT